MAITADRIGPVFKQPGASRAEPQPKALAATLEAYQAPHRAAIDKAEAESQKIEAQGDKLIAQAEKLYARGKNKEAEAKEAEANKLYEAAHAALKPVMPWLVSAARVGGQKGVEHLVKTMSKPWEEADAGNALACAKNATIWSLQYSYQTRKPMEGWLTDLPADKKVTFNVVCTPSAHAGGTDAQMKANYEKFATENVYEIAIVYEAPDGKKTTLFSERKKVQNPPEYATLSSDFSVDLSTLQKGGKLHLMGAPIGSAGVEAYVESRRTVIHL
jgi:hypothetical protein